MNIYLNKFGFGKIFESTRAKLRSTSPDLNLDLTEYTEVEYVLSEPFSRLTGLTFANSGSNAYLCTAYDEEILSYELSTPYDLSTATKVQTYTMPDTSGLDSIKFNSDGTRGILSYIKGSYRYTKSYSFSTAWDVSSHSSGDTTIIETEFGTEGGFIVDDGLRIVYTNDSNSNVTIITLTEAWNTSGGHTLTEFVVPFDFATNSCYHVEFLSSTNLIVSEYGGNKTTIKLDNPYDLSSYTIISTRDFDEVGYPIFTTYIQSLDKIVCTDFTSGDPSSVLVYSKP